MPNVKDEQVRTLVEAVGLPLTLCTDRLLALRKALGARQATLHLEALDQSACLPWLSSPRQTPSDNAQ
jgi:hypothetical protein